MKTNKYIVLLIILSSGFLSGCKKDFLDLNSNPNYPEAVPAASLLAPAEVRTAAIVVDPSMAYANVWMDYWAFSPNYAVSQDIRDYRFINTFGQGTFSDLYANAFDYQKMIDFAVAQNNPALEGIGRTMKSFLMQWAVDVYNNVPYTDAFKGANNKTPTYESGQSVYEKIYDDLNLAIKQFNNPLAAFPSATEDIMFKGNKALWIKMANTTKLRILLRQSGRADRASYIQGKLASDFPGRDPSTLFLQAGEGAVVNPGYANSASQQNPYWASFGYSPSGTKTGNNDYFKVASFATKFYASQNDVRLFFVAKPVPAGGVTLYGYHFLGNELGSQGDGTATYSDVMDDANVGGGTPAAPAAAPYRSANEPQPVLADFESLFLQAEAVQRGWFPGDAKALFNKGQLQSFVWDFDRVDGKGAGADNQAALTPTSDNNWDLATDKIKLIITQKWAAMNTLNFFEPWIEYRRTGFPNVTLSSSTSRGPKIPLRLKYPQFEYDLNGANVQTLGTIDQFTSKIWWMP